MAYFTYSNKPFCYGIAYTMNQMRKEEIISKNFNQLCTKYILDVFSNVSSEESINIYFNQKSKYLEEREESLNNILNDLANSSNPHIRDNYDEFQKYFKKQFQYFNCSKTDLIFYVGGFVNRLVLDYFCSVASRPSLNEKESIIELIIGLIKTHYPKNDFPSKIYADANKYLKIGVEKVFEKMRHFFANESSLVNGHYTFDYWIMNGPQKNYSSYDSFSRVIDKICRGEELNTSDAYDAFFSFYANYTH